MANDRCTARFSASVTRRKGGRRILATSFRAGAVADSWQVFFGLCNCGVFQRLREPLSPSRCPAFAQHLPSICPVIPTGPTPPHPPRQPKTLNRFPRPLHPEHPQTIFFLSVFYLQPSTSPSFQLILFLLLLLLSYFHSSSASFSFLLSFLPSSPLSSTLHNEYS